MKNKTPISAKTHHVRTFFASLFGALGVWLILTSILVVWLNRTLTDTNTFSTTVAPLVTKPAIQDFIADKVTTQLVDSTSPEDIATTLLPTDQTAGKSNQQLQTLAQDFIHKNVIQIVRSPSFAVLWNDTTRSAHQQFIGQLNSGANQLTLDLSPAVAGVITQLKQTDLAPVSDKISIKPDTGKINLKGSGLDTAHHFYKLFKSATIIIVALAVLCIAAAVALSVHHWKTVRRILFATGIAALLVAALLEIPSVVKIGGDSMEKAAAVAFIRVLVRNLQLASLVIGVVCVGAGIGSKYYSRSHPKIA